MDPKRQLGTVLHGSTVAIESDKAFQRVFVVVYLAFGSLSRVPRLYYLVNLEDYDFKVTLESFQSGRKVRRYKTNVEERSVAFKFWIRGTCIGRYTDTNGNRPFRQRKSINIFLCL